MARDSVLSAQRSERDDDYWPLCSTKVKYEWNYNSALPCMLSWSGKWQISLYKNLLWRIRHITNSFLRSLSFFSWSRNFRHFMENESSLPCSQEPATRPHPEPDQSSPRNSPHPVSWRTVVILPSHLCLGLPSGLLPSGLQIKPCMNFSSLVTLSGNQRN
jgi:hypothetical protein